MQRLTFVMLALAGCLWAATGCRLATGGGSPRDAGGTRLGGSGAGIYHEAPMLRSLVDAGELPPVDERLPTVPVIIPTPSGVGSYGGTLRVLALDAGPWGDLQESPHRGPLLMRMDRHGNITGDVAERLTLDADLAGMTLTIREGLSWSDGAPVTAADVLFMFEDLHWREDVATAPSAPYITGVSGIDVRTVHFELDRARPEASVYGLQAYAGEWSTLQPRHYLQRWHLAYNPQANALARGAGYRNWQQALRAHFWHAPLGDPLKPTLQPWRPTALGDGGKRFVRNPFFHWVDTAGNQLPYVDRLHTELVADQAEYRRRVLAGDASVAYSATDLADWPAYLQAAVPEGAANLRVTAIAGSAGAELLVEVNQHPADAALDEVVRDLRFRQALSYAIDRDELNRVVYHDLARPRQATLLPGAEAFREEWAQAALRHDPDRARRLLDAMGLQVRDAAGQRLRADGQPLELRVLAARDGAAAAAEPALELLAGYWRRVGIGLEVQWLDEPAYEERARTGDYTLRVARLADATELGTYVARGSLFAVVPPANAAAQQAPRWAGSWATWLAARDAVRRGERRPGTEPPPHVVRLHDAVLERNATVFGSDDYRRATQQLFELHAEHLFLIGTVGQAPTPLISSAAVGNIPAATGQAATGRAALGRGAAVLFFR